MGLTLIEAAKVETRLENLAVNEGRTKTDGVVEPLSGAVHLFGGDVDVDRSIADLQGPEARASQVEMKMRSMRLTLEAALINGDPIANQGRGFEVLARRLPSGSEMALSNGGSKFLVMSKAMRRQLNALARAAPAPPSSWPIASPAACCWWWWAGMDAAASRCSLPRAAATASACATAAMSPSPAPA
jgi:hypothetical protein